MQTQPDNLRASERAVQTRPAYLYHLVHGGTHYYLTGFDATVVTTGTHDRSWEPAPIGHELGDGNAELSKQTATVGVSVLDAEFRRFFLTAPTHEVRVEIWRCNSAALPGPLDFDDNFFLEFSGIALSQSFSDATIAIEFGSETAQDDRPVLRFNFQPQCNHFIYGEGCHVDRELHCVTKTVGAMSRPNRYVECVVTNVPDASGSLSPGVDVTAQSFEGGYLLEVATGNMVGIVSTQVTGDTVRLFLQWMPTTLLSGVAVKLYKGCKHTKAGCVDDFNNLNGQLGVVSNLTVDGSDVVGLVPIPWREFASRHSECVPLVGGSPIGEDDWTYNAATGQIRILGESTTTAGYVKLPRIGGFGGHPYIPVANPAVDGVQ